MGLLLSILVFSVGVLEALACVRHIQQGILPAWAPRHVTTVTGRQLLRERWRKSTSQDDGSGDVSGDVPQANGVPSRHLPASRQRSIEEEHLGKPRPPPLTLSESPLHHVRSPDIHWPEPLPHSPVKCDEHTLPSPVPEVPGDAPAWPSVPPPEPEVALLQRRRTSTTETLPEEDQRHAKPLRDATPEPSFAREGREPSRLKPAKASSFEEARFEPFALPESKAPEVISLSYSDFTSAGPRTAVVGRMEIKATKDESEDGVTPWPIVNIDTVVTPDEEGDVTPPANVASRRVSFDPVPTVVLIDKEKTVAEEKQHGVVLAPSIKITDDLEGVLRKELPSVIDEIIEEALLKTNSILDARQNGAFSGVSLILETLVAKGDDVLIRPLADGNVQESQNHIASDVETFVGQIYKDNVPKIPLDDTITHSRSDVYQNKDDVTKAVQDVLDAKVTRPTRLEDEPLEQSPRMETLLSEDGAQKLECRSQRSFTEVDDEEVPIVSEDSSYFHPNECKSVAVPEDINLASSPRVLSEDSIGIATDLLGYSEQSTKDTIEPSLREDEHETRNENKLRNEASEDIAPQHPAGKQPTPRREIEAPKADEEREAVVNGPPSIPVAPEGLVGKIVAEPVPSFDSSASTLESTITPETPQASNALVSPISIESSVTSASSDILDAISAPPDIPVTSSPSPALVHGSHDIPTVATSALPTKSVSIDSSVPTVPTSSFSATSPSPTAAAPATHAVPGVNTPTSSTDSESTGSSLPKPSASAACAQPAIKTVPDTPCQSPSVSPHFAASATSASATTQKSAITPAAARAGDPSSESSGSSSSDRSAAGGRVAAPAAAKAPAAPQQEAFWLIFSGEYTKAMSKDWHSGHFCCWQCDESLTGQRYVLRDDHPYCIKCYESVFANVCEECNRTIGIDSKDLSYKDKHWHEACFLCTKCRVSLVDKQFGSKADKIYCGNCYDAQFASRCDGCGEIFRAGTKKMEYKTRQWHEKCFCCCVCKSAIGTKSFIPREQEIYCAGCYEEKFATRCVKCNKIITSGGVTYKNEPWHRECFTCTNCNTSLAGQRFTSRDEKPYCADCFGELFAKRCTACSKPITGIGGTRFISFEDRHWHNDCFICASCKTSLVGRGFITDAEDIICPECAKQKLM